MSAEIPSRSPRRGAWRPVLVRAALLLLAGAVLAAPPWGAGPLRAQPRVVTQEVWAEAPVEEDNLAEARRKAISIGHQYLLLAWP